MLSNYYYNKLNNKERSKYSTILQGVSSLEDNIKMDDIMEEETTIALINEHPELYYCNLREINYLCGPFSTKAQINYLCNEKIISEVNNRTKVISSFFPDGVTEETVRAIHNYIVKNVEYDYISGHSNAYEHEGHTVIGPLLNGKGVCEGIALLFKRLLDLKGIDNTVVVGEYGDAQGIYHMWNVVSIQGRNYYIDITQDIATTNKNWGKPSYMFYMLTEEEIHSDHGFNDDFNCHNTIDNPFHKAGRVFSNIIWLEQYIRSIPPSQRLINFKYTGSEPKQTVTNIVTRCMARHPLYPKMSVIEHYGRYYFFKEI